MFRKNLIAKNNNYASKSKNMELPHQNKTILEERNLRLDTPSPSITTYRKKLDKTPMCHPSNKMTLILCRNPNPYSSSRENKIG